jgi:hypothetical protein
VPGLGVALGVAAGATAGADGIARGRVWGRVWERGRFVGAPLETIWWDVAEARAGGPSSTVWRTAIRVPRAASAPGPGETIARCVAASGACARGDDGIR